ncbi:MAG: nodulation protein NfeD [Alphaproteobacteria bacterium]
MGRWAKRDVKRSPGGRKRPSRGRIALWSACLALALAVLLGGAPLRQGLAQDDMQSAAASGGTALVLRITGVIGPAVSLYLREGLEDAVGKHDLVILEMDTPGGLDTSMREMIQAIIASPVPVASYVSPSGSRAASAGTYILYASHVAAMAPSTTLGAATPIQLGGGGGGSPGDGDSGSSSPVDELLNRFQNTEDTGQAESDGEDARNDTGAESAQGTEAAPSAPAAPEPAADQTPAEDKTKGLSAAERKAVNDAAAYIRGLATLRGRNAEWAEEAVRKGVSLDSSEAVKINVIDLVAQDLDDLLTKIDGRTVTVTGGRDVTLDTEDLTVVRQGMTWIQELLATITNPNIAFVLMQLGVLGLIIELYNPGAIFPGVVGVVCLLLGLTALAVLPVSIGGLALLFAGLVFMVLELFVASGGILAAAGAVAFGFGAFFLFDTDVPEFRLSILYVLISTAIMAVFVFAVVGYALSAQRRRVVTGAESMVGEEGRVLAWEGVEGTVRLEGEVWRARSEAPLQVGQTIVATRIDGLVVWVRPA